MKLLSVVVDTEVVVKLLSVVVDTEVVVTVGVTV